MKCKALSLLAISCLLVGVMPLASCTQIASLFGNGKSKSAHAKHAPQKTTYDAGAYVANLTMGRLALSGEDVSDNVAMINSYAGQKKSKAEQLMIIIIDYKINPDAPAQQFVAPAITGKADFPYLQLIMDKLNGAGGAIQNIHLAGVVVRADKSLALPKESAQLTSALDTQQRNILTQSHALEMKDDIKTQLALIDFFTKHLCRDAAYLSVDNVKRMLAKVAQNKNMDDAELQSFSKDLEKEESNLKSVLPYNI